MIDFADMKLTLQLVVFVVSYSIAAIFSIAGAISLAMVLQGMIGR